MATIKSSPAVDSYTAVHWLVPAQPLPGGDQEPRKVIIEVGADRTLLNVILPDGVSFTVWGNGDAAVFTDPDDELGENPDVRIEGGRVLSGGYDTDPEKAAQHQ